MPVCCVDGDSWSLQWHRKPRSCHPESCDNVKCSQIVNMGIFPAVPHEGSAANKAHDQGWQTQRWKPHPHHLWASLSWAAPVTLVQVWQHVSASLHHEQARSDYTCVCVCVSFKTLYTHELHLFRCFGAVVVFLLLLFLSFMMLFTTNCVHQLLTLTSTLLHRSYRGASVCPCTIATKWSNTPQGVTDSHWCKCRLDFWSHE